MSRDEEYMEIALAEARAAMREGNPPIGALLVINNGVIGTGRNCQETNLDFFSHAEASLIGRHAAVIREALKEEKSIELFATLEPCFMCFGTAVHSRIGRVVFGCPDPKAGVTAMQPPTEWYRRRWPEIVGGVCREVSYELFTGYMRQRLDIWGNALGQFEEMRRSWK